MSKYKVALLLVVVFVALAGPVTGGLLLHWEAPTVTADGGWPPPPPPPVPPDYAMRPAVRG